MPTGEAFGVIRRTNTVFNDKGAEVRADEFDDPFETYLEPAAALPEKVREFMHLYPTVMAQAVGHWHDELSGAAGMIVNHATNDVSILIDAVERGSGRTAARTARALFEHLVHYKEIASSPAKATQYEEHRHVTATQLSSRRIGLQRLSGKARTQERDWLVRLGRNSKGPLAQALRTYGSSFQRSWTAGVSLHTLAKRHGLLAEYDSYRILSGVMHGSAGALLGTRRETRGEVTHRLGPDLRLVPLAFHEGLTWWRELLEQLPETPVAPGWNVTLKQATDSLLATYPELHATCRRLDNRLWPDGAAPVRSVSVLAVYPGGKRRWFHHDITAGALSPAELDGPEPPRLNEIAADLQEQIPHSGGRPATAAILGTRVRVLPGRRPVPAAQLLMPRDVFGPPANL